MITTDATYGATQTVVSFLTQTGDGVYATRQRVFDFEISRNSQAAYNALMETLLMLQQSVQHGSGSQTQNLQAIANILNVLDAWSQMKVVENGQETANSYKDIPIIGDPSDPTSLAGILQAALQNLTYVKVDASGNDVLDSNGNQIYLPVFDATAIPATLHVGTTMNRYMAESLDTLLRTMRAAGWDPIFTKNMSILSGSQISAIASVVSDTASDGSPLYGLTKIINQGIVAATSANLIESAAAQSQSIQQLLMVDYVVRGNEMLFNEMNSLNNAIQLNQNILSYLNSLQSLMNQKTPQQFLLQLQYLSNNQNAYSDFEQQTFGNQTLSNVPDFTDDKIQSYLATLTIKNQGLDPNDPLIQAQYGLQPSYDNLTAVLQHNLSSNLVSYNSTTGSLQWDPSAIDLSNLSTAQKYNISYADYVRYNQYILPNLTTYLSQGGTASSYISSFLSVAQKARAGLQDVIPGVFESFSNSYNSLNYYLLINQAEISNPNAAAIQVIFDDSINRIVIDPINNQTFLNAVLAYEIPLGVGTLLASPNNPMGITAADLSNSDKTIAETKFMAYAVGFFNSDGTTHSVNGMTFDDFMGNAPQKTIIQSSIQKMVQDGKDFTNLAVQKSYGLIQGLGTSGALSSQNTQGTAADVFIDQTTKTFDASITQIQNNLETLINKITVATGQDSSALAQQLRTLKNDFTTAGSISKWVSDFSSTNEGTYQGDLNNAITASQALNDTERENLREVMFVYEEFYKSATGMLESLSQLIKKIANNMRT